MNKQTNKQNKQTNEDFKGTIFTLCNYLQRESVRGLEEEELLLLIHLWNLKMRTEMKEEPRVTESNNNKINVTLCAKLL